MERQVFKKSILGSVLFIIVFLVVIWILYRQLYDPMILLLLIVPILSIIPAIKNKLVIENGNLRLEQVIRAREVSLEDVAIIMLKESESRDSDGKDSTKYYMNVIDQAGHTFFRFSTHYLTGKGATERFVQAVHAINPDVEINFETNFDRFKQDVKQYYKQKKNDHNSDEKID